MSFVHLQTHSEYSILGASCRIQQLLDTAIQFNQPAIALTDHDVMFGMLEFTMGAQSLNKKGKDIKAIAGCHIHIHEPEDGPIPHHDEGQFHRIVLLAENNEGYHNLLKIVSWRYETPERWNSIPVISLKTLKEYSKGLIALTGDLWSRLGHELIQNRDAIAKQWLQDLLQVFDSDHLFLTLQNHGLDEEQKLNEKFRALSQELHIPLVVTNNVHYLRQTDSDGHRAVLCIAAAEQLNEFENKAFPTDQYYLKSSEEMLRLFPNDTEALANTLKIADRCHITIRTNIGDEFWPKYEFPPEFSDADAYLAHLCHEALPQRYQDITEKVRTRLDDELKMIQHMKVAGYLLIVWDFINWARQNNIPVGPGRGSAAGSIVTYIIGITNIDPLRFDLLFERFLNPERVSMPDIDTDFSDRDRHQVIKYVSQKYGADCVTQIVTYGAMKAKAVVRDVGRVLGIPPRPDVDQIAKLIPTDLKTTLKSAWDSVEDLRNLIESQGRYQELWKLSIQLEGMIRQTGVHAAAVIIAPVPMSNLAPLYRAAPDDTPVIQYDKHFAEDIGLLKMDFLGLRNLSVIQDAVQMIEATRGIKLDIDSIQLDDAKTFTLLGKGLTVGVFQFESAGMQGYLRNLGPTCLEDLIAMNALYRPGPLEQIPRYIACKHGQQKVDCYHEDLEQILGETYGVMVYQEQVMRIAQILAGYTLGGADLLRRAMAKKDEKKMAELEVDFIEKAVARGYDGKMIKRIWDDMLPFCGYAFNKSHAAAYSYVAYQTAYLKANFGPEFMAANMTSEMDSTENLVTLILECRKMGIEILHPDINHSRSEFSVEGHAIRYGLSGIKNVGTAIIEDVVGTREQDGPFTSMFDLCKRVFAYQDEQEALAAKTGTAIKRPPINKRTLESLIMAGALDHLAGSRAALHATVDKALEIANRDRKDRNSGQISLFDLDDGSGAKNLDQSEELEHIEPWTYLELLNKEKDVLGLYLSGHPIDEYRAELRGFTTCSLAESEIAEQASGTQVTLGGIILSIRSLPTRNDPNKVLGIARIQDFHGDIELFLKPAVFEKYCNHISTDQMVLVRGKLDRRDEKSTQVMVERIIQIDEARYKLSKFIHIELRTSGLVDQTLRNIQETVEAWNLPPEEKSGSQLVFHVETGTHNVHILKSNRYRCIMDPALMNAIGDIVGNDHIWVSPKL